MAIYPPEVGERLRAPRKTGSVLGANAVGAGASFECGCFVRFSMSIEAGTTVADARFRSNGCGFMIASADLVAENLSGRNLTELHAVDEREFVGLIESELGLLPPQRTQCARVVLEAVRATLFNYRADRLLEFNGEKALICTCFGVTEEAIEKFVEKNEPASVDDVTAACRAGGGCGSCRMLIQEMLDARA